MTRVAAGELSIERARMEDLDAVTRFVEDAALREGLADEERLALRLAAEEAFTNIVQHGYAEAPGPVRLGIARGPDGVTLSIADRAPPFDPAAAPPPDLTSDWEERAVGGLGWHLVRELVDEVRRLPRDGGGNLLLLLKRVRAISD